MVSAVHEPTQTTSAMNLTLVTEVSIYIILLQSNSQNQGQNTWEIPKM